ncbi:MAG: tRNA(Ile)-lysidine synthetase [Acidobacteria bacterium OLB17]|nr:MAG: tRNA(Ile)-lysidine synthetase [Acidobacteria bacterium OLB17]MCZ2390539.1 tRNA lysidine(34) synthetase TilS [Acidobacteriota bacterium]
MRDLPRKVITEWRRLGFAVDGGAVVIACSGGADSTALLLAIAELAAMKKLGHKLIVAHFDHALRKDSREDAAFVRGLCLKLGIEFVLGRSAVAKRGNLEDNARRARYRFLARAAAKHKAFLVLTGHTIDDQAETFLLNLIRGSGPDGLSAMPVVRPLEGCDALLARPFLRVASHEMAMQFCTENDVEFRVDPMNSDPRFSRVRIRREVLPLLAELNPKIVKTLARTAELFRERPQIDAPPEELPIRDLAELDEPARLALLRIWLIARRGHSRRLTSAHINAVNSLAKSSKSGRFVELPSGGVVQRSGGLLAYRAK